MRRRHPDDVRRLRVAEEAGLVNCLPVLAAGIHDDFGTADGEIIVPFEALGRLRRCTSVIFTNSGRQPGLRSRPLHRSTRDPALQAAEIGRRTY